MYASAPLTWKLSKNLYGMTKENRSRKYCLASDGSKDCRRAVAFVSTKHLRKAFIDREQQQYAIFIFVVDATENTKSTAIQHNVNNVWIKTQKGKAKTQNITETRKLTNMQNITEHT